MAYVFEKKRINKPPEVGFAVAKMREDLGLKISPEEESVIIAVDSWKRPELKLVFN